MSERFWDPGSPCLSIKDVVNEKALAVLQDWASDNALAAIEDFIDEASAFLQPGPDGTIEIIIASLDKPSEEGEPQGIFTLKYQLFDLVRDHISLCIKIEDIEDLQRLCVALDNLAAMARTHAAGNGRRDSSAG